MYVAELHHGSQSLFWLVSCQVEEESHLNKKLNYQHLKNTRPCVLILVHFLTQQIWEEGDPSLFKKRKREQTIYCIQVWVLKIKHALFFVVEISRVPRLLRHQDCCYHQPPSQKTASAFSASYFMFLLPKFWYKTSHSSINLTLITISLHKVQ